MKLLPSMEHFWRVLMGEWVKIEYEMDLLESGVSDTMLASIAKASVKVMAYMQDFEQYLKLSTDNKNLASHHWLSDGAPEQMAADQW